MREAEPAGEAHFVSAGVAVAGIRVSKYRATTHNKITVINATGEALNPKTLLDPGVADGTMSVELLIAECRSMGRSRLFAVAFQSQASVTEIATT